MSGPDLPERRRDEESDWHDLVPASCPRCGCRQHHAADDPAIVWEPGRAWDEGCSDRSCSCHTEPLVGRRRD
ncbi:MAG: hypothetical protein ACRDI0_13580 [Actinomycetota bacterium]